MSDALLVRLQASLRALAAEEREHVELPHVDAFIDHVRTPKYYSFAVVAPDAGPQDLPALRAAYAERGRNARIEFFEALNPDLEGILLADGWTLSERMPVMTCTPAAFLEPPVVEGLDVVMVDGTSSEDLVLGFLRAQRVAFKDESPITPEEVLRWRARAGWHAAGLLGDEIAGTALCTPPILGVTEVGGVATPPQFRRRGIAAAVTAIVVAAAFEDGADIAWLTAAGGSAQGIYARAGFEVVGTLLAYDAG